MKPSDGMAVSIRGLSKRFGGNVALEHIDLDVYDGEFLSLLGPSGCGKTTLLRTIAGFETPDTGDVLIFGESTLNKPPHRRPVNTVFQSYALFPHMSARDNVLFGLKMSRVPKDEARERAQRAMETVEIERFADRKPHQLSGGQRQRVALARAVVNEPNVLLLDEPLGALDLKLRKELQVELMLLQDRLGITFIYVTHDQEEALVMSDRIAVMKTGLIDQLGPVEEVYERPRTPYVATFLGTSNLLEGTVTGVEEGVATIQTAHGPLRSSVGVYTRGEEVSLSVRPEKIFVMRRSEARSENVLLGEVMQVVYTGVENQYRVQVGETLLLAYVMNKARTEHDAFAIGDEVALHIPPESVVRLGG